MKQRGRPPWPGLLTPREEEVLGLIRRGLSNREIADELSISLQGVKYHVTEILGKLGVESRDEAATWEAGTPTRRWGFLPLAMLPFRGEGVAALVTPKLAAATLGVVLASGLAAGLMLAGNDGEADADVVALVGADPTPTPDGSDACRQARTACMIHNVDETEVASLEEAAGLASFRPRLPTHIPAGFDERTMVYRRPTTSTVYYPDGRTEKVNPFKGPYNDEVSSTYSHADGRYLGITQGYYSVSTTPWHETAPDDMNGTIQLDGLDLRWFQGTPRPGAQLVTNPDGTSRFDIADWDGDNGSLTLFWTMSAVETGTWEVNPDGVRHDVTRPLNYVIIGSGLPLDELLKVAASVLQSP